MKKMMAALVVAGIAMIPVGVYAADAFGKQDTAAVQSAATEKFGLADKVYGSYADLKKAVPTFKMEDYKRFNDKLESAQAQLGATEYAKFETLLTQWGQFTLKFADANGGVDTSKMNADEQAAYQALMEQLAPYFEQLNG